MQRRDVALLSIGSLVLLLTLAVFFVVFGRQSEGPTLAELGLPAANLASVFGLFAPARTPAARPSWA